MPKKPQRKKQDRMASKGYPNPIDVWVGRRLRMRRTVIGMSQEQLADKMGLTFQQVQKYERGANRVSGSRLFDVARILDVHVSYFFEEMPEDVERLSPVKLAAAGQKGLKDSLVLEPASRHNDPVFRRETMEFVRAYEGIKDESIRNRLKSLVYQVSGVTEERKRGPRHEDDVDVAAPVRRTRKAAGERRRSA